ncbi:MAG: FkbM family methyltransferase [Bryobacteraceae bacterium]|nr:FkbM family methyltransferase [Bryobacteraceae bacterium]
MSQCWAFVPHVGWLRHDPGDEVIQLLRRGHFEAVEQAFLWLYLRPGDLMVDCGAHVGLHTIGAQRACGGSADVIALEPNESSRMHLLANLERNSCRARVIDSAAWKDSGGVEFDVEAGPRSAFSRVSSAARRIPSVTLAQILQAEAQPAALIKLDIEGAEPEALAGAAAAIRDGRAPVWIIEFTEDNLQRRGSGTREMAGQLGELGLRLFELDPESLRLTDAPGQWPLWNRNLIACADPRAVNHRLSTASGSNIEVARDLLARAAACQPLRELEELGRYKAIAATVEQTAQWAERSDRELGQERALAREMRQWAERTEGLLNREREESAALRDHIQKLRAELEAASQAVVEHQVLADEHRGWAEQTESFLTAERKLSAELREWAEKSEALLRIEIEAKSGIQLALQREQDLSRKNRDWAENTERLLALEREMAAALRARVEKAEADLSSLGARIEDLRSAREQLDRRLTSERDRSAAAAKEWERVRRHQEELLAAGQDTSAALRDRAKAAESLLAAAHASIEELRLELEEERNSVQRMRDILKNRAMLLKHFIRSKPVD